MLSIVLTEFQKIKRYHILLIGIIGMTLSPVLGVITQNVAIEEAKNPNVNISAQYDLEQCNYIHAYYFYLDWRLSDKQRIYR